MEEGGYGGGVKRKEIKVVTFVVLILIKLEEQTRVKDQKHLSV